MSNTRTIQRLLFTVLIGLGGLAAEPSESVLAQVDPDLGDGYSRLVLRGATVIDGTGGPPVGPRDIVVSDGRIEAILPAGTGQGDRVIDAEGQYVMPGIIDAHTHLGGEDVPEDYIPKLWLAHGVTTVRVFSSPAEDDLAVRLARAQRSGTSAFDAPKVVVYPFWRGDDPRFWDPEGAREIVREWSAAGHDGVKVAGKPGLLPDILPVIAEEAARSGMGLAVHIGQDGVYPMDAVAVAAAGATTIEHHYGYPESTFERGMQDLAADHDYGDELKRFRSTGRVWDDADMDLLYGPVLDSLLELSIDGRFTMVPTFSVYEDQTDLTRAQNLPWLERYTWPTVMERWTPNPDVHGSFYFEWTSADEAAWSRLYIRWLPWVNAFKNRGGHVAVGSDSGTSYHLYGFGTIRELELMQRAGFHPLEIVRAATQGSARAVGLEGEVGVIRPGYEADLLVLDRNPLADFKLLYGTGAARVTLDGRESSVTGLRYTILDGKVIDARALLDEVARMVERATRGATDEGM